MQKNNWADSDLARPDVLAQFSSQFQCNVLLHGNISWPDQNYPIEFIAQDSAGKELFRDRYEEPRQPFKDANFPAPSSPAQPPFYFAGVDGVTMPKATYAPDPDIGRARKKGFYGTVLLSAVVTTRGTLSELRVLRGLDRELDQNSLRTLATWRLTPANGPDGTPVPVRLPFEVTLVFSPPSSTPPSP